MSEQSGNTHQNSRTTILSKCAMSGLPLGFLPKCRVRVRAQIPFAQLEWQEARRFVIHALDAESSLEERKFAFCTLFYQIPAPLLQLFALPVPDWECKQIASMLNHGPLRALANAIESLRTLPERFYTPNPDRSLQSCLLPPYRVYSDFAGSNTHIRDFPAHVNLWLQILHESEMERNAIRKQRRDSNDELRAVRELWSGPRKQRNEVLNLFDTRNAQPKEWKVNVNILAAVLDVEPTKRFYDLCAQPWLFDSGKLENILLDVRAAMGDDPEFLSATQRLLFEFVEWLDRAIIRAKAQEQQAREIEQFIEIEEAAPLIAMDVPNAAELVRALNAKIEARAINAQVPAKPRPLNTTNSLILKARAMLNNSPTQ